MYPAICAGPAEEAAAEGDGGVDATLPLDLAAVSLVPVAEEGEGEEGGEAPPDGLPPFVDTAGLPPVPTPRSAAERINQRIRAMSAGTGKAVRLVGEERVRVITSPPAKPADRTGATSPLPVPKPKPSATCKDVLLWLATTDNERLATCALVRPTSLLLLVPPLRA